jgi:hypothetical protein
MRRSRNRKTSVPKIRIRRFVFDHATPRLMNHLNRAGLPFDGFAAERRPFFDWN